MEEGGEEKGDQAELGYENSKVLCSHSLLGILDFGENGYVFVFSISI